MCEYMYALLEMEKNQSCETHCIKFRPSEVWFVQCVGEILLHVKVKLVWNLGELKLGENPQIYETLLIHVHVYVCPSL